MLKLFPPWCQASFRKAGKKSGSANEMRFSFGGAVLEIVAAQIQADELAERAHAPFVAWGGFASKVGGADE